MSFFINILASVSKIYWNYFFIEHIFIFKAYSMFFSYCLRIRINIYTSLNLTKEQKCNLKKAFFQEFICCFKLRYFDIKNTFIKSPSSVRNTSVLIQSYMARFRSIPGRGRLCLLSTLSFTKILSSSSVFVASFTEMSSGRRRAWYFQMTNDKVRHHIKMHRWIILI